MSANLVNSVRARPRSIRLGATDGSAITVRVELPEVWDTVRVEASPGTSVAELKSAALAALSPQVQFPEDMVIKIRGFEVLDENASLHDVGAVNGSIFLLTYRRRRPVR